MLYCCKSHKTNNELFKGNGVAFFRLSKRYWRPPSKGKGISSQSEDISLEREAESWEVKLKAAMKSGHYYDDAEAQRQTLGNAIDRYLKEILSPETKNRKTIVGQLAWWKQKLGKHSLAKISSDLISRAKEEHSCIGIINRHAQRRNFGITVGSC